MRVRTLRRHGYAKQIRMPGEEYEIQKEKDVKILEAVGRIRRIPEVAPAPPKEEPLPIEEVVVPAKKKATRKKAARKKSGGSYRRKDMRAE